MDSTEERLREIIRTEVQRCLDEISTTGGVAGYLTPKAFVGDKKSNAAHAKKSAKLTGYELTKRGNDDIMKGDNLNENYYTFRNEEGASHKKIGDSISRINKEMKLIERALRYAKRLKKEQNVSNDALWTRTRHQIVKLEQRCNKLTEYLRELRS
jgi:hypothetical protein